MTSPATTKPAAVKRRATARGSAWSGPCNPETTTTPPDAGGAEETAMGSFRRRRRPTHGVLDQLRPVHVVAPVRGARTWRNDRPTAEQATISPIPWVLLFLTPPQPNQAQPQHLQVDVEAAGASQCSRVRIETQAQSLPGRPGAVDPASGVPRAASSIEAQQQAPPTAAAVAAPGVGPQSKGPKWVLLSPCTVK